MPAPGSVWASGTWATTAWAAGTWADAVTPPPSTATYTRASVSIGVMLSLLISIFSVGGFNA